MRRGPWAADRAILAAAAEDGVIKVRHLMALGVPEATAYRRCREGGAWQLLGPGIVLMQTGPATRRQQEIAALLHGGPDAMLTGAGAARHHGLRRLIEPAEVMVLVPLGRQSKSVGFIVVERTARMPRAVVRDGLRVAPLVRALCDRSRRMRDGVSIAALFAEAVQRRMLLPQDLVAELDAGCRKGTSTPRRVLRAVHGGVRSGAEYECREWWIAQPELPEAEWNVRVLDEDGTVVAIADALVRGVGFVWEIDSVEQHFATPEQVEATARRRRRLLALGLYVVSTRPTQRRDDPDGVKRDLLDGLAIAARMPPPRVTFTPDLPGGC